MPCMDGGPSCDNEYENDLRAAKRKNRELKKRLDLATRLLCEVYDFFDAELEAEARYMSDELRGWYDAHVKADKARQAREARKAEKLAQEKRAARVKEQARVSGLEKLTHAERTALGL